MHLLPPAVRFAHQMFAALHDNGPREHWRVEKVRRASGPCVIDGAQGADRKGAATLLVVALVLLLLLQVPITLSSLRYAATATKVRLCGGERGREGGRKRGEKDRQWEQGESEPKERGARASGAVDMSGGKPTESWVVHGIPDSGVHGDLRAIRMNALATAKVALRVRWHGLQA